MKPMKEKISITLDKDMLQELRQLAEEDDRSLSSYINLSLKKLIHYDSSLSKKNDDR